MGDRRSFLKLLGMGAAGAAVAPVLAAVTAAPALPCEPARPLTGMDIMAMHRAERDHVAYSQLQAEMARLWEIAKRDAKGREYYYWVRPA